MRSEGTQPPLPGLPLLPPPLFAVVRSGCAGAMLAGSTPSDSTIVTTEPRTTREPPAGSDEATEPTGAEEYAGSPVFTLNPALVSVAFAADSLIPTTSGTETRTPTTWALSAAGKSTTGMPSLAGAMNARQAGAAMLDP